MTISGTPLGTLHGFSTPAGIGVDELEALLASTGLRPDATTLVRRTYYDTFDARLYRAGWVLEHERLLHADGSPAAGPDGAWLRLRPLRAAQALIEQPASTVPRRADDLADERLRGRVVELAGGRALLAQLESAPNRERLFRCLGPEEKTVARVVLASDLPFGDAAGDPTADGSAARPPTVWALAVRGYDEELAALTRALGDLLGDARPTDPYESASHAAGRTPGLDPSAFDVVLDPGTSADRAIRALIGRLLEVVVANEPGVRGDLDDEFLHDFRVAIRRARSLLSVARGVVPEDRRLWLAGELRWLGQLTGPPRDLDVLLEDLTPDARLDPVATPEGADLAPFVAQLHAERRQARAALLAGLDSERYRSVLDGARELVATDAGSELGALELAGYCVRRASRRLLRKGRVAITAEDWHEVRKAGKRLRYVVEGFRSLLGDESAEALGSLKRLQNVLGDAQDRAAHAALIRDVALRWAATAPAESSPSTARGLLAAGGLVERHRSRGRKVQAQAAAAFVDFDTPEVRARLQRLARTAGPPAVTPLVPGPGSAAGADEDSAAPNGDSTSIRRDGPLVGLDDEPVAAVPSPGSA